MTTFFRWTVSGAEDSSFIPTSRDSFGITRHYYEVGGEEAAIRQLRYKFEI
jgi:hypothetical protein